MSTLALQSTLTATEAAVVASVNVRDVNRVIDERILPKDFYTVGKDRTRRLSADSCVLICFYFKTANRLTAAERIRAISDAGAHLSASLTKQGKCIDALANKWLITEDSLTIDFAPFVKSVLGQLSKLEEARALVEEDADILGGVPVIRNTRIPVYDVAASVAAGISTNRLVAAYSGLTAKDVELVAFYAEANPQRGRPRRSPPLPSARLSVVATRRLPRRKRSA